MNGWYDTHFKEELVATAILMGVVITGSFVVAYRALQPSPEVKSTASSQVLGVTGEDAQIEALVREILASPTAKPKPIDSPLATITPAAAPISSTSATTPPTYNNTIIEQPYGNAGEYDTLDYRLTIANPRLVVSASRIFKVDVTLSNKRIATGLKNRLSATIIKEGAVIAESAPFSLSQSATAFPGEQITFTATMSLIAGTDIARLKYLPLVDGVADTLHDL